MYPSLISYIHIYKFLLQYIFPVYLNINLRFFIKSAEITHLRASSGGKVPWDLTL